VLASPLGIIGAVMLAAHVPAVRAGADTWWTLALGVTLVVAGAALRDWAIWTLGRYFRRFVTIQPGQTLVRSGPYRWLRHPSHSGILLAVAGIGLAFGSWLSAAIALVCMFVALLPRIRVEERALAQTFATEYDTYAHSTWRLCPHVW
jgi:protein-S-isoprenylcysteine O-methyltransferase Ste14